MSRVEGSLACPSYPAGRANFSYISLHNLANRLHEKQKVGSAGRVTRLAGSPFFDGRVTLLAGPTFLHINTLARPAGSTPSGRDNQSMRDRCWLGQRGQLSSYIKCSLELTRLGVTLFPGTTFLLINGAYDTERHHLGFRVLCFSLQGLMSLARQVHSIHEKRASDFEKVYPNATTYKFRVNTPSSFSHSYYLSTLELQ